MKSMKHRVCLVVISLLFIVGNLIISRQTDKQVDALQKVSNNNKELLERVKNDQAISDKIIDAINIKEAEVLSKVKSGDIETLKTELGLLKIEINTLYKDFSNYKQLHEQNKISQNEIENYMNSTSNKIAELDGRIKMLETGLEVLDGSIKDSIKAEIGDINVLKEQIKQELIQELTQ